MSYFSELVSMILLAAVAVIWKKEHDKRRNEHVLEEHIKKESEIRYYVELATR